MMMKQAFHLLLVLSTLTVCGSVDSFVMDLVNLTEVDLSALGTMGLSRYQWAYNLTVDEACEYLLKVDFVKPADEDPGEALNGKEFTGVCDPNATDAGTAPDGLEWHAHRRYWAPFPQYVYDTTGFDHMSLYWRPCGLPPKGLRQPRYEMIFYTVIPEYRAFWACEESGVPLRCDPEQTTSLGRSHFTLPGLDRDPDMFANMPVGFSPDYEDPEVYAYEGLISWGDELIPETANRWILPNMDMSTYDGDVTSFRALLPYSFMSSISTHFYETKLYNFPTYPRLPSSWNMTYTKSTGVVSVYLSGSAGMCGDSFDAAKAEAEEESESRRWLR
eukprot:Nitzschia sp. Nitz4//scaffold169_size48518//24993//25985//NITZ4_007073-RA/size48518-processed-gene-0.48-mRNA-1//-1//CDS//3329538391//6110//frame0